MILTVQTRSRRGRRRTPITNSAALDSDHEGGDDEDDEE